MSDGAKIELFGDKELNDFFESMSRTDQRKIIMDSYRDAAKPLLEQTRSKLKTMVKRKTKTKNLYKSMGFVPGKSSSKSVFVTARVGARRFGAFRGFHGHLFDAGTTTRENRWGHTRGRMPGTGFFSGTVESLAPTISKISEDTLLNALEKLIARKLKAMEKKASK
jgi:hypothetical protein